MDSPTLKALFLLAVLFCAPALRAAAPDEPCITAYRQDIANVGTDLPASSVFAVLSQERNRCILGTTDTTPIPQLMKAQQNAKTNTDKATASRLLFQGVLSEFDGLPSTPCDGDTIACTVGRHVAAIRDLQRALDNGPVDLKSPLIKQGNWTFLPANPTTIPVSNANLNALLTNECAGGPLSDPCLKAVDFSAKVLRTGEAMHAVVNASLQPIIDINSQFLTTRDKEWNSYLNDVSVQYPWELWINSAIFQKNTPLDERSKFPQAPNSKWVVLHPSLGFERVEADTGGRSTTAAVFMEFVGYEHWNWDAGSGVASYRWGASLVASAVNSKGSNSVGYGLLLKTPFKNTALGVVWRNGDRGHQINLAINVDVSKLIQQYKQVDLTQFIGAALTGPQ